MGLFINNTENTYTYSLLVTFTFTSTLLLLYETLSRLTLHELSLYVPTHWLIYARHT